jgi:hypothetical protein
MSKNRSTADSDYQLSGLTQMAGSYPCAKWAVDTIKAQMQEINRLRTLLKITEEMHPTDSRQHETD